MRRITPPLGNLEQLQVILKFWKLMKYIPDRYQDITARLDMFLYYGGGDCEDFATAGKALLETMGWYCTVVISNDHAVLKCVKDGETHWLDSATLLLTDSCPIVAVGQISQDGTEYERYVG